MRCNKVRAVAKLVSGVQLVESLGLLQVERVETLSEPTIDRSEKILGLSWGFEGERASAAGDFAHGVWRLTACLKFQKGTDCSWKLS